MPRTLPVAQIRRLRAVLPGPRDSSARADAVRQPRMSARTWPWERASPAGALGLATAAPAYAFAGVTRAGAGPGHHHPIPRQG